MDMDLPIDVVKGTHPPRFRWMVKVNTPVGPRVMKQTGTVPVSMEGAMCLLLKMYKDLKAENEALKKQLNGLADRIAAQSELLTKRAEAAAKETISQQKKQGK